MSNREMSSRESAELRHTLRTPINHMIGYTELLLEDTARPGSSEHYLAAILASAQKTLVFVQQHLQEPEIEIDDLQNLRRDLSEPVAEILDAAAAIEKLESGTRLKDVRRIQYAAQELAAFARGKAPARPDVKPFADLPDRAETPARILASFLAVDDSEPGREILCRLLERQGHTCVAVGSGEEALERLRAEHFDMVLLDLMMPGMNGIDTLRTIKADPHLQEIAVVMLSAFDEVDEIGKCLEMGAEDYLLKPFDRIVLNARLYAILERKRLQNLERRRTIELELADVELRRSNDELRRFASVVSHDLQEPLRMVTSYMQLLKRSLGTNLTDDQRDYLNFAVDGGKRMNELIHDLLAYSRVSATEPQREPVDFGEVIEEVKVNLTDTIEESSASIVHFGLPRLMADRSQIRQLFQNLIINAIKYRSDLPPTLKIEAKKMDQHWLFSVADNGMGIDPEHRQGIFEMFSRAHDRSVPGTGIGLSICQRVVERLSGRIWVESEPGRGSTFYFTVPA